MKWTFHLEDGPKRVNHAAVLVGDKIFSFGGYTTSNYYEDCKPITTYVLNPDTLRWTLVNSTQHVARIPIERFGHSVVAYKEKIYLWGGKNSLVPCNRLACFDTETYEWTYPQVCGQVPLAKDAHTACLIQNRMYIFGGFKLTYSKKLRYLNMDTMEWHLIQAEGVSPSRRDFHTAVAYGDKMYIFGGRGYKYNSNPNKPRETYCSKVFILETVGTHKWNHVNPDGPWPSPRRCHSAWVYEDYMYIFGGCNGLLNTHFNDVWRYSFKDNLWMNWPLQGVPPSKRRRQQCIMYGTKMFLFGGTSPAVMANPEKPVDSSEMHILDLEPSLKTLAICRILEIGLDISVLPWIIQVEIRTMAAGDRSTRRDNNLTG